MRKETNMFGKKLCINISTGFSVPLTKQPKIIKNSGFDGVFWNPSEIENNDEVFEAVKYAGLEIQSFHAPFGKSADMWLETGEAAQKAEDELIASVHTCAKYGVPVMVSHVYIGFDEKEHIPTDAGLCRYKRVIDEAAKYGIKIAFENTEGEEYLEALLNNFAGDGNVGFCWDSGHEMCYNGSRDLLAKYGRYLFATHINDNLGVKDPGGKITWLDDLHLLPFDGIADWQYNAERLVAASFSGPLTFELKTKSIPMRHENDRYNQMSAEQFFAEAYVRACRVGTLVIREEQRRKQR